MSNDFELLSRFLERYGNDVEGRELDEIPSELQPKLRGFALGTLSESDRRDVAIFLKEHPRWVGKLAEEARNARPSAQSNPDASA
jgi:hypothetical protein